MLIERIVLLIYKYGQKVYDFFQIPIVKFTSVLLLIPLAIYLAFKVEKIKERLFDLFCSILSFGISLMIFPIMGLTYVEYLFTNKQVTPDEQF
jgi:hypothetical protein